MEIIVLFGSLHLAYLYSWLTIWVLFPVIALKFMDKRGLKKLALALCVVTVFQEGVDYWARLRLRDLSLLLDLPLHYCHLAQIWSMILLFYRQQLLFEITYFWGLAGALQAMLTPDFNAFGGQLSVFLFFSHHGLLILTIFWLIFVMGYRCRRWAVIRVLLATNLIMILVYAVDSTIGANYMYLRKSPLSASPFIYGDWPDYILNMEVIALIMMALLQMPMTFDRYRVVRNRK